jgi:hypothetical protein
MQNDPPFSLLGTWYFLPRTGFICKTSDFFLNQLSKCCEELKVANSAFHDVGWHCWLRRAVQGHRRCHLRLR